MTAPIAHPLPPLGEHQVKTLALLLRRAVANGQLALHEQMLNRDGTESELGASLAGDGCTVDVDEITYDDGTAPRLGLHLYIPGTTLDGFCD